MNLPEDILEILENFWAEEYASDYQYLISR